ncbi:MAG: hypothetical protein ACRDDY_05245 [Clostridium sp.]|uniref:hypothetical protein n=1 Tax=Clostridium sp. TaxID=1506 RepID=UPI003EE6B61A
MSQVIKKAIFRLDEDLYPMTVTGKNGTGGDLENGAFVEIGVLEDNELGRETYGLSKLTGTGQVGFVSSPSLMYDERQDERDFVCKADELIRTYIPNKSTVGTFAEKHFENGAALVAGDKLAAKANSTVLTKAVGDAAVVAQVITREDFEGQVSVVVKFL